METKNNQEQIAESQHLDAIETHHIALQHQMEDLIEVKILTRIARAKDEENKRLVQQAQNPDLQQHSLKQKLQTQIQKIQAKLNLQKRHVYAIVSLVLMLIAFLNHQLLKEHCIYENNITCLRQFIIPRLPKWISLTIIDGICYMILMHFSIKRVTYPIITILAIVEILFLYILSDQTVNDQYYIGLINVSHILLLALLFVIYIITLTFVKSYQKNKKIFKALLAASFVLFIVFYFTVVSHSCDYWSLGMNGQIEEVPGTCSYKIPKYCWYKITDRWFDLSIIFHDCKKSPKDKRIFNDFFSSALKEGDFVGFKNLNQISEHERTDGKMQKTVPRYARGFKSVKEAQIAGNEVIFDSENQVYHIEVLKNDSLAKERAKLFQTKKNKSLAKNMLLIFVDAVSRSSMHLKLPRTVDWFKKRTKQYSYKRNFVTHEAEQESYEFYRFNSFYHWTTPNLLALMYDKTKAGDTQQNSAYLSILNGIKDNGYITGHSSSLCQQLNANFGEEYEMLFMNSSRFDHETQSFSCDPNFQQLGSQWNFIQGPYSIGKRCLYGKTISQYTLEYAQSFFTKYNESQKFYIAEFSEAHEATGEGGRNLDKPISTFLENLTNNGLLDDTVVMLYSDHGLHMQGMFTVLKFESVLLEQNIPGLFINLPEQMNQKYGEMLALNQQNLIGYYNLHHFVKNVIIGDTYEQKDKGLLGNLDSQKSCSDIGVIEDQQEFCSCK